MLNTYLFRLVKGPTISPYTIYYGLGGWSSTDTGWVYKPIQPTPSIFGVHNINSYLIDTTKSNIEMLRFVANTLSQAEMALLKTEVTLYSVVYKVNLGEKITSKTPMILLLPFGIRDDFGDLSQTYFENRGKYYTWHSFNFFDQTVVMPRHTLRGSGRYKAVVQYDSPRYFYQDRLNWDSPTKQPFKDEGDFIGLEVAFPRIQGRALKHVYRGGINPDNYYLNATGNIVFHDRGSLYHGEFDSYRKSMSAIWPMLSKNEFDSDGVLVEGHKVASNGFPNLITQFNAQRRSSYSKQGNAEIFKRRLLTLLVSYNSQWCSLISNIQASGHNLNYDVNGYQQTKFLYLIAEKILRLISRYFPRQLTFDASKADLRSDFDQLRPDECLRLGNRADEVAEVWDALVTHVDWMRRNWVDYSPKGGLGEKVFSSSGKAGVLKTENKYMSGQRNNTRPDVAFVTARLTREHFLNVRNVQFATITEHPLSTGGYYYYYSGTFDHDHYTLDQEPYTFSLPYSPYNNWLESTSQIAADIEIVYLAWQVNAIAFMDMTCHFLSICDSKPLSPTKRAKGQLPGEIVKTEEQEKNLHRTYLRAKTPRKTVGTPGTLRDIKAPTVGLPDLKPYQIDSRAIVRRCAMDTKVRSQNEEEEERRDKARIQSVIDREKFAEQQRINDAKKARATEKPQIRWRSEIDSTDREVLEQERGKMYEEIADGVSQGVNLLQLVEGAVEAFEVATAPGTTPLIVAQHMEVSEIAAMAKPVVKRLAVDACKRWFESEPEFEMQGQPVQVEPAAYTFEPLPRPAHEYAPPKRSDEPGFTGRDDYPREYVEITPTPDILGEAAIRIPGGRVFRPADNGVDLRVIHEMEGDADLELRQEGVRNYSDIPADADEIDQWTEKKPLDRYLCVRAAARLPR